MTKGARWLLPDGVDELLPQQARNLEILRRRMIDLCESWGYKLVMPPMIEFLDSLLSGNGEDLDLQTFKLIDQLSGRLMGLRADITPQIARIDAHRLPSETPQRLCYVGPVLHTKPENFSGSRNPFQAGAELYGHAGIESDVEVICLMAEVLAVGGLSDVTIELGHMGVFKGLVEAAGLSADDESAVLAGLLRKSGPEVFECLHAAGVAPRTQRTFEALLDCHGDAGSIEQMGATWRFAPPRVRAALTTLASLVALVRARLPSHDLHIDLAELRGYRYHTGVIFAAYSKQLGRALAYGGRYDNIGRQFGRHRDATGFSIDLKTLIHLTDQRLPERLTIFAEPGDSAARTAAIAAQRARGNVVIEALPGQTGGAPEMGCARVLREHGDGWRVEELEK